MSKPAALREQTTTSSSSAQGDQAEPLPPPPPERDRALEAPSEIIKAKREIARIMTILRRTPRSTAKRAALAAS